MAQCKASCGVQPLPSTARACNPDEWIIITSAAPALTVVPYWCDGSRVPRTPSGTVNCVGFGTTIDLCAADGGYSKALIVDEDLGSTWQQNGQSDLVKAVFSGV